MARDPDLSLCLAASIRERIETALAQGQFTGGWMIAGPPSVGKATLATRLGKTLLSNAVGLGEADATTASLIDNRAHPDFFVLERVPNEKTGKLRQDIAVDQVRKVSAGLHRTSTTGRRVVIVDLADHLRREAANALLKTLEEPPAGTVLFLLTAALGFVVAWRFSPGPR